MEALIEALNTEDIPAIESLLKQGVDLNVKDDNGIYPLNYAYQRGIDVTALLLEYGADPDIIDFTGTSPLHDASSEGNVDMAELLLIYGADPNITDYETDDKGRPFDATPLHYASMSGNVDVVKVLLDHGANPNVSTGIPLRLRSALHIATEKGYIDVVKLLLDSGADPNLRDKRGDTALSLSLDNQIDIAKLLILYGATM